jgi:hypothetical protein
MPFNMMSFARTLLVVLLCSAVLHVGALTHVATFGGCTFSLDEAVLNDRGIRSLAPAIFANVTSLE